MEPMKPEEKENLNNASAAAPADVEEYERLLSERFMIPPPIPGLSESMQESAPAASAIDERIRELHVRIYGSEPGTVSEE